MQIYFKFESRIFFPTFVMLLDRKVLHAHRVVDVAVIVVVLVVALRPVCGLLSFAIGATAAGSALSPRLLSLPLPAARRHAVLLLQGQRNLYLSAIEIESCEICTLLGPAGRCCSQGCRQMASGRFEWSLCGVLSWSRAPFQAPKAHRGLARVAPGWRVVLLAAAAVLPVIHLRRQHSRCRASSWCMSSMPGAHEFKQQTPSQDLQLRKHTSARTNRCTHFIACCDVVLAYHICLL